MNGYAGKILRVNLSSGKISSIPTSDYQEWVGGHGMGSAIFWDLCPDKKISGFDERNVITIMTSPLTGTIAPGASTRTEMQGIGVQSYPVEWFTRSNLGGRFGAMLKFAGWDGIVVEGAAEAPVWIDVRDGVVKIQDARGLWGKDTWETQGRIWEEVAGPEAGKDWIEWEDGDYTKRTTQRPAVMAIGRAGENRSRLGAVIHDAGNAAGQGGFGGVWGAKNLKAISVIGSGSVKVADPKALLDARLWSRRNYSHNVDDPAVMVGENSLMSSVAIRSLSSFGSLPVPLTFWRRPRKARPQACVGCPAGCRSRTGYGEGNESSCAETVFYTGHDAKKHGGVVVKALATYLEKIGGEFAGMMVSLLSSKEPRASYQAADLSQKHGINAFELLHGIPYLRSLYKMGELGPGKRIECDLPFDQLGEVEFIEALFDAIGERRGIGDDLAEGFARASERWGRLEQDLESGLLLYPHWGLPDHYDPRFQVEWGFGSIMGDRDINEHGFNILFWMPTASTMTGKKPFVSAQEAAEIYSEKMVPFEGDPRMIDYSDDNIYTERFAKLVAWHRRYSRFWKQSVLFCDYLCPDFMNTASENKRGMVGEAEPKFINAVTGGKMSFGDGIELGRKIWNLDNAVWTLQGRHRDMVQFAPYIYKQPFGAPMLLPGREGGKWKYVSSAGRVIDQERFEQWKTKFYELEGWASDSGWPTRKTLASMGMDQVADELDENGKLGRG